MADVNKDLRDTKRCRCTYEAGDSECFVHPTCSCCGEETEYPVRYCFACTRAGRYHPEVRQ